MNIETRLSLLGQGVDLFRKEFHVLSISSPLILVSSRSEDSLQHTVGTTTPLKEIFGMGGATRWHSPTFREY
jgi:hypothetical protein